MIWYLRLPRYTEGMLIPNFPFSKYEKEIVEAVNKLQADKYFHEADKELVVNTSFIMAPSQENVGGPMIVGQSLVSVAVISKDTGRVYYFALRFLVPKVYKKEFGK